MEEERLTTADLLTQWRDATRAAELAERLAEVATRSADESDAKALASEQIARMAEKAGVAAERASRSARKAATTAAALAAEERQLRTRYEYAEVGGGGGRPVRHGPGMKDSDRV